MKRQLFSPLLLELALLTACPDSSSSTPSFDLTLNPASVSGKPGDTTTKITFTIARKNGFVADVITSISSNAIVGTASNQVKMNAVQTTKDSGTLEFVIGANVPLQTYPLEFRAVGGGITKTSSILLEVNSGITPPTAKKLGTITILDIQSSSFHVRSASALFYSYKNGEPPITSGGGVAPDTCFVIEPGQSEPTQPASVKTLDAGTEIKILQGTNTYTTLLKTFLQGKTSYSNDPRTPLAVVPTGLTVSVPGTTTGFPAFNNVALPEFPADFTVLTPALGDPLALDGSITWEGGLNVNNEISVFLNSNVANSPSAICFVQDDGSFTIPANVKTSFEAAGLSSTRIFTMMRSASRSETANGATLSVSMARGKLGL
jgi:hypothetical protein